jgi:hypothetical protein
MSIWKSYRLFFNPDLGDVELLPLADSLRGGSVGIVFPNNKVEEIYVKPEFQDGSNIPARGVSFFLAPMTDALYMGSSSPQADFNAIIAAGDLGYGIQIDKTNGYFNDNPANWLRIKTGVGDSYANRVLMTNAMRNYLTKTFSGSGGVDPVGIDGRILPFSPNANYYYYLRFYFKLTWPTSEDINQGIVQANIVFVFDSFAY